VATKGPAPADLCAPPAAGAGAALPERVAALLRPETYPFPPDDPELYETHVSWVVLAGPFAFKMKKPVELGFLDFSTAERRRAACQEELRLNRRLCPDVYLGVVDLVERDDGGLAVGGPGRPVEPLVWMRRLPAEGMLPRLIETGGVEAALMRRIAARLAAFHAEAATGPGVDEHGSVATLRANWDENFAQTAAYVGRTLTAEQRDAIAGFVDGFLERERDLLARRVAGGRVRDGHGDLHGANVCLEGGTVHLFDCLEFAPRFRCADVAAEVAFLAMDLAHLGRADLAQVFVDAYVAASGDADLPRLLPFYLCYRAFVRGKVLGFRLDQPGLAPEEAARIADQARAYFDLALSYARADLPPLLVVVTGPPASGKTTLAGELARRLGWVHLSSDAVRKELAGIAPTARRRERFGEGIYGPAMRRRTYETLRRRAGRWLRRGLSVVLDAMHGRPADRRAARALAARAGARLVVLWCEADEATTRARLAAREGRADASDARLEHWPALRAAYRPPLEAAAVRVDTSGELAAAVAAALAAVGCTRAGGPTVGDGATGGSAVGGPPPDDTAPDDHGRPVRPARRRARGRTSNDRAAPSRSLPRIAGRSGVHSHAG
jgi:aminoglycoside phosphotransferase family enzyme/predicted kinase